MTDNQWDSSADWYDQNMGETGDELNGQVIKPALLKALGDLSGKTVLDAGCGSGYLTAEVAKSAKEVVGTDFSQRFIEICQKKYASQTNVSFQQQDVTEPFSFGDSSYDVIFSKMVLQYVPQIATFAFESSRLLTKNGQLVIVVDHPFFTQFYYAQELAGKKNPKYADLQDYFSEGERTKLSLWGKVELTWFQRKVSDYVNAFADANLRLVRMEELFQEKDETRIPRILLLDFSK